MKVIHHHCHFRRPLLTLGKLILLISGIMLLGFSSCRTRPVVKYGGPPAAYKQIEKSN